VVAARQPPVGKRPAQRGAASGHRLRLLFMTQTAERPPRFSIQVNSRARVTRDYAYFIENRLRERYRLEGVPAIIDFVERNERRPPDGRPRDGGRRARDRAPGGGTAAAGGDARGAGATDVADGAPGARDAAA
jgi:GTP-binding protein